MNEQKLRAEMSKGAAVAAFTETDEFKGVISTLAQSYVNDVMTDRNSDSWFKAQVLVEVVNELRQLVVTGSMAAKELHGKR